MLSSQNLDIELLRYWPLQKQILMCVNVCLPYMAINNMSPIQNCHHFGDDIFKSIFFNENACISLMISLNLFLRFELTHVKISSAKLRPFCLGLNVLTHPGFVSYTSSRKQLLFPCDTHKRHKSLHFCLMVQGKTNWIAAGYGSEVRKTRSSQKVNRPVLLARALLATCRELTLDYNTFPKGAIYFWI